MHNFFLQRDVPLFVASIVALGATAWMFIEHHGSLDKQAKLAFERGILVGRAEATTEFRATAIRVGRERGRTTDDVNVVLRLLRLKEVEGHETLNAALRSRVD